MNDFIKNLKKYKYNNTILHEIIKFFTYNILKY